MNNVKATEYCQHVMSLQVKPGDHCVDATAGNGHDTLFLAKLVGQSGRVDAFDIQECALQNTADLLQKTDPQEHLGRRVRLHLQSHAEMDREIKEESISLIVFNFGYLPGGDHRIATEKESSLRAVSLALKLLMPEGVLLLTLYSGGDTGEEERNALLQWASQLDPGGYLVLKTDFFNRGHHPPVPMVIVKLHSQVENAERHHDWIKR